MWFALQDGELNTLLRKERRGKGVNLNKRVYFFFLKERRRKSVNLKKKVHFFPKPHGEGETQRNVKESNLT